MWTVHLCELAFMAAVRPTIAGDAVGLFDFAAKSMPFHINCRKCPVAHGRRDAADLGEVPHPASAGGAPPASLDRPAVPAEIHQMVTKDTYLFVSMDLTDAYFQIPIKRKHRKLSFKFQRWSFIGFQTDCFECWEGTPKSVCRLALQA